MRWKRISFFSPHICGAENDVPMQGVKISMVSVEFYKTKCKLNRPPQPRRFLGNV
jgi:hypothetical protein